MSLTLKNKWDPESKSLHSNSNDSASLWYMPISIIAIITGIVLFSVSFTEVVSDYGKISIRIMGIVFAVIGIIIGAVIYYAI